MRSGRLKYGIAFIRNLALQSICDGVINRIAQNLTIAEMRSCTNAFFQGTRSRRPAEFNDSNHRRNRQWPSKLAKAKATPRPLSSLVLLVAVKRRPFKSSPAGMRPPAQLPSTNATLSRPWRRCFKSNMARHRRTNLFSSRPGFDMS